MAKIFGKWLRYMVHGVRIREAGLLLEMAYEFEKHHKYVGNDVYMWEMA